MSHMKFYALTTMMARILFTLFVAPLLVSCYATTDRLAVYENAALNGEEVEVLAGHYHLLNLNGGLSSLSFTPISDPWPYKKDGLLERMGVTPFFPQPSQKLASVNMSFRDVTRFDNGDSGLWRIDGVAVFSYVPGTDLILGSIAGETLQIYDSDSGAMTPRSEEQKKMNIFFVLKQDGKALTVKLFSESDEGLAKDFDDPSAPLPTDKLLVWLKKNAADAFDENNLSTYLRSTSEQKARVEKRINAAFAENNARKDTVKAKAAAKVDSDASGFDLAVSEAAARALHQAKGGDSDETQSRKSRAKSRTSGAGNQRQSGQDAANVITAQKADPTKITSIHSYYIVDKEAMTLIKVQKRIENGVEEFRFYDKFRSRPYGLRHFPRNDFDARGYWYPDSQQFYLQGWFNNGGSCGGWSESNWSYPFGFRELYVDGKTIKAWSPSLLSMMPIPEGREKKRICIGRRLDANSCSVIRCLEWSDPRNTVNAYLVRSRDDALLIYNEHFGHR